MAQTEPLLAKAPFRLSPTPERSELLSKYFRALGEPTRLRILELLVAEGELSVGDIGRRLGVAQSAVSNHLACLRWCGFVHARREHRVVYNRVADNRVASMIDLARGLLDANAEHVAACCRIERA